MKIVNLQIESDDPKVVESVMKAMKKMRSDLVREIGSVADTYRYSPERISHKEVVKMKGLMEVLEKISNEIEDCENGTKMLEEP